MALAAARRRRSLLLLLLLLALASVRAWDLEGEDADAPDEEDADEDEDDGAFDFFSDEVRAQLPPPDAQSASLASPRRLTRLPQLPPPPPPPADRVLEAACASDGACAAARPLSALARGLVTTKPSVASVLREHARADADSGKRFAGEALGYVTPWNARGYALARVFRRKLDYVAPVWLQVREDARRRPLLTGAHDIDGAWVRDVKYGPPPEEGTGTGTGTGKGKAGASDRGPKVVPRVLYERNQLSDTDVPVIVDALLELARAHDLDGFVFEIPIMAGTMDLLTRMGDAFQAAGKLLLLVLPRASDEGALAVPDELLLELAPRVHRFTLNAYDFRAPGPNAPLPWLEATLARFSDLQRSKILVGLPFYGYDNNGTCLPPQAVTGPAYVAALRDHGVRKIRWDAAAHECRHEYTDERAGGARHVVFFPCLQFLHDRLELFAKHGVGVGVWELGQGLEYFFDLL